MVAKERIYDIGLAPGEGYFRYRNMSLVSARRCLALLIQILPSPSLLRPSPAASLLG